mmetsp:Transcript_28729/g.33375  ORF Transcript_28729/g.33375 Transcript_28729/m.33375 type:complete len:351 (-) Transcript_28729:188-1240(-)
MVLCLILKHTSKPLFQPYQSYSKNKCPKDAVDWHLRRAQELLDTKCTVLKYGLELDELMALGNSRKRQLEEMSQIRKIPTILWNARLEEDKNPGAFLDLLHQVKRSNRQQTLFYLIVLGTDPSKEKQWETRIHNEFTQELIHLGWCSNREEYAQWLTKSDIVISTANHETFGISIVESVFCGALPLLPNRLSYPELFPPQHFFKAHLYTKTRQDGVEKLLHLLKIVTEDPAAQVKAQQETKAAVARFRWANMGEVYDQFFMDIGCGEPVAVAGAKALSMLQNSLFATADVPGIIVFRKQSQQIGQKLIFPIVIEASNLDEFDKIDIETETETNDLKSNLIILTVRQARYS